MLSKTAEYALRAVTVLATVQGRPVSADKVAEQTKIPRRYLHKVLQDLTAAGLMSSRPGPGGGYELVGKPETLTILDVVNAVDPIARITSCPLGLTSHTSLCPLHRELDKAYASVENALRKVTLADVVLSADPIVPLCDIPAIRPK